MIQSAAVQNSYRHINMLLWKWFWPQGVQSLSLVLLLPWITAI